MLENLCRNCFNESSSLPCPHCGYTGEKHKDGAILPVGTILNGKYLVGKCLGRGGFGVTYLAFDLNLHTKLCIKEYFPGDISTRSSNTSDIVPYTGDMKKNYEYGREKFVEEGRTLARLNSLNTTASIFDFFLENNTAYLAMEYLDGQNLGEYLKSKPDGRLSLAETKRITKPILDTLSEVHSQGIIHRDIAPDNIFITKQGDIKLLDFGAARYAMGEKSKSLSVILKKGYAPYEQYSSRGKQGPWTDIYALGATIFKMLTGKTPIEAIDRQIDNEEFLSDINLLPENIRKVIYKAMELKWQDRLQSADEFKLAINIASQPKTTPTYPYYTDTHSKDIQIQYDTENNEYEQIYSDNDVASENQGENSKLLSLKWFFLYIAVITISVLILIKSYVSERGLSLVGIQVFIIVVFYLIIKSMRKKYMNGKRYGLYSNKTMFNRFLTLIFNQGLLLTIACLEALYFFHLIILHKL